MWQLLVEEVVSRHGVPSEILSDRGQAFLSGLMKEVELLLGFHKVNTTAYHPQTNGLVERYNRTLTAMFAKTVKRAALTGTRDFPACFLHIVLVSRLLLKSLPST
jgi:transposase InsO family protein